MFQAALRIPGKQATESGSNRPPVGGGHLNKSNLCLIDGEKLVALVLKHYEQIHSKYKGLLPLKKVDVPETLEEEEL